jgi:hypothetical protein
MEHKGGYLAGINYIFYRSKSQLGNSQLQANYHQP